MCRRFNFKEATEWGAEGRKEGKQGKKRERPTTVRSLREWK